MRKRMKRGGRGWRSTSCFMAAARAWAGKAARMASTAASAAISALMGTPVGEGVMECRCTRSWTGVIWGRPPWSARLISKRFTATSKVAFPPAAGSHRAAAGGSSSAARRASTPASTGTAHRTSPVAWCAASAAATRGAGTEGRCGLPGSAAATGVSVRAAIMRQSIFWEPGGGDRMRSGSAGLCPPIVLANPGACCKMAAFPAGGAAAKACIRPRSRACRLVQSAQYSAHLRPASATCSGVGASLAPAGALVLPPAAAVGAESGAGASGAVGDGRAAAGVAVLAARLRSWLS
mmetsp:Transcript_997/g.3045  ORF Transcript_997/g.3045 Transcript_997/m.3045 type:complete len:293 (+) Transcript_997:136-1014(+)